jgi:hypothetical protein
MLYKRFVQDCAHVASWRINEKKYGYQELIQKTTTRNASIVMDGQGTARHKSIRVVDKSKRLNNSIDR